MNSILKYIQNHPQETQRLLGFRYDQLKQLLQKAIELHNQKQSLAESEKVKKLRLEEDENLNYLWKNK